METIDFKRLSIILGVSFFILAVFSLFSLWQNRLVSTTIDNPESKPQQIVEKTDKPKVTDKGIDSYFSSEYRPVYVAYQTVSNDDSPDFVAIFMNKYGYGGANNLDPYCGSSFSEGPCYIILEPRPKVGVPDAHILTTINSEVGAIDWYSVKFKDKTITFDSGDGDAGCSVSRKWSINIETGAMNKLFEETNCTDEL